MTDQSILSGKYNSLNGKVLDYGVYSSGEQFLISFKKGRSGTIARIFPSWAGHGFMISKYDFENFKKNVVNNPLESWIVTLSDGQKVEIPGVWTTDTSGGKKRGHKRSGHKRSGHKRSGHKRSKSHKRSHKKSRRH
jgi:hypothetical protein